MECSSMAIASCFRLIATILLLAMAARCSSQQMDHIQLSRIAGSIDDLTQVVQGKAKSEGESSGSSASFFFLITSGCFRESRLRNHENVYLDGHKWDKDEPNNPAERCVHYNHLQDDRLNDVNCSWKYRYICKKPAQLPWNFASVLDEEMPADK